MCIFHGCPNHGKSKTPSLCPAHYAQKAKGKTLAPLRFQHPTGTPWQERFTNYMKNVQPTGEKGCLEWPLSRIVGYGAFDFTYEGVKRNRAHHAAYIVAKGHLPPYASVHHACANRACCNPEHLKWVEPHENNAEMMDRRGYEATINKQAERIKELENLVAELLVQQTVTP
jgi:hypothetical protein